MNKDPLYTFKLLKQDVQRQAAQKLGIVKPMADWSLQDIRDFQTDLEAVCKSAVSEKWIYTHFKNDGDKLPRIDVLNLLCEWIGAKNWDTFLRKQSTRAEKPTKKSQSGRLALLTIPLLVLVVWLIYPQREKVTIVFKDAYSQEPIDMQTLNIKMKNQTLAGTVIAAKWLGDTLVAGGPYYKQKKVALPANAGDTIFVELLPDDYALMLNFFSRSTADDLDQRRAQLLEAIHPEARIFQSHPQYEGIELLNREEFIDRLILPTNSLKNLEIQHIFYRDEKIYRLQFIQKSDEQTTP